MRHGCRVLLAGLVLLLAACAAPTRVSLAPGALPVSQTVTIVVPPEPKRLGVFGFHPGMAFGLVGGVVAGAHFEQVGDTLTASMLAQGVRPYEALARAVAHELEAAGYRTLIVNVPWTDAIPVNRVPRLLELGREHERVLVLNPLQVWFASFMLRPYRPTVRVTATLYGSDRSKPIYATAVETGYDVEHTGWMQVPPGPIGFATESDLIAQPARTAESLRDGLALVAQAVVHDMLGAKAARSTARATSASTQPPTADPREYTGTLHCAAQEGAGRVDRPAPFEAPVRVSVSGTEATMRRGGALYSESLSGRLDGTSMRLEGRGAMKATPDAYWITRVSGQFSSDGQVFQGTAQLIDGRGNVFRRCTIDLVKFNVP